MLTHSKSVCRDFGCIGHCLCMTFLNCVSLFPNFLPHGLRSTAMTSWSGLHFRVFLSGSVAFVEVAVANALLVVVALGEAVVLLILLVSPP
jgi:hypothetical protein